MNIHIYIYIHMSYISVCIYIYYAYTDIIVKHHDQCLQRRASHMAVIAACTPGLLLGCDREAD